MFERPKTSEIPDHPGAYLFRDKNGRVIYVGKAKSLRSRVASYFGVGLHPRTPGNALTRPQFNKLWKLAVKLLTLGVKHNRIITIDPKTLPADVSKIARRKLFRIFKKSTCPACDGTVEQFALSSRKVFACPACQAAPIWGKPAARR